MVILRYSPTGIGPYGGDYPDERPRVRGGCYEMPRPCPFVSCKHHLIHDIHNAVSNNALGDAGETVKGMRMRVLHDDPCNMRETCALDRADEACEGEPTRYRDMGIGHETARRALQSGVRKLPEDLVFAITGLDILGVEERWSHWDEAESLWYGDLSIPNEERDAMRAAVARMESGVDGRQATHRDRGPAGKARGSD